MTGKLSIRSAIEQRIEALVLEAVALMRQVPGSMSGDSRLKDVFDEWAHQLAFEHSIFFEHYQDIAHRVCRSVIDRLRDFERKVLAAYAEELGDVGDADDPATAFLFQELRDFAVNYAEDRFTG